MVKRAIIHLKSPEYPYKTLCGLNLKDVEHTPFHKKATCKRCKQILRSYRR